MTRTSGRVEPEFWRNPTIDEWLAVLEKVREKPGGGSKGNGGYMALCPAHDDKNPSLSLDVNNDGTAVVECMAGCKFVAVKEAAGLNGQAPPPRTGTHKKKTKVVTTEYVRRHCQFFFELPNGETAYAQRHKGGYYRPIGGDKWINNLDGVARVPYKLPELLDGVRAGKTVIQVEGCKDVLEAYVHADPKGEPWVVTTTGGTNSWRPEFKSYYAGARVIIVPDKDEAGREYAETVAGDLVGVAESVKVVELPGLAHEGADLSDWIEFGKGRAGDILALAEDVPEWTARSSSTNSANGSRLISAAELLATEFEPTRWVVPDVLPEGVHLLVAKPKKGKSWMALGLCEAIAAGGVALGVKKVEAGDTLYLALEDNKKRLQRRLKKVLGGRMPPERMTVTTEWPKINEGGTEKLDEWLTDNPEARLVVIDTLAKVRNPARGQNIYAEDYAALEPLLPLAAKHGVAIVVVYHLRKMAASDPLDEISSSTGLTAGVDGFMILRRTPGGKGPTLYIDGRDIEEPTEYALHWNLDTATWTIEGEAEEVHMSRERADILLTLNRVKQYMTPKEVTEALGPHAKYNNIKYLMWAMFQDDQLVKDDKGRYYPAKPTNPPNSTNRANRTNPTNPTQEREERVSGLAEDTEATNPTFGDTYAENEDPVSGVSGVSGDGTEHGDDCLCGECVPV